MNAASANVSTQAESVGVGCSGEGVGEISAGGVAVGLKEGVIVIKGSRVGVDGGIVNGDQVADDCVPVANVELDGDVHWAGS